MCGLECTSQRPRFSWAWVLFSPLRLRNQFPQVCLVLSFSVPPPQPYSPPLSSVLHALARRSFPPLQPQYSLSVFWFFTSLPSVIVPSSSSFLCSHFLLLEPSEAFSSALSSLACLTTSLLDCLMCIAGLSGAAFLMVLPLFDLMTICRGSLVSSTLLPSAPPL